MTEYPFDPDCQSSDSARETEVSHPDDLATARSIAAGSVPEWHEFIDKYAGLVHSVIRRYLFSEDDVQTVYVLILEKLYKGKLAAFQGRSALSTWLMLVARNETVDFIRRSRGRLNSTGVNRLNPRDRLIFRLFFEEGLRLGQVRQRLIQETGDAPSLADLALIIQEVESQVDNRVLRALEWRRQTMHLDLASYRLLACLDHLRTDQAAAALRENPEFILMEKEARKRIQQILAVVGELPAEEQKLLSLRYWGDLRAREVAAELGIDEPRRVYRMLERSLKLIRKMVSNRGMAP